MQLFYFSDCTSTHRKMNLDPQFMALLDLTCLYSHVQVVSRLLSLLDHSPPAERAILSKDEAFAAI